MWLDRLDHIPICGFLSASARLNLLTGSSMVSRRRSVMCIRIRSRRAVMQEVEVATLVGLGDVLRKYLAVAAGVVSWARLPRRLALRQLLGAYLELELARRHIELVRVAVAHTRPRSADQ